MMGALLATNDAAEIIGAVAVLVVAAAAFLLVYRRGFQRGTISVGPVHAEFEAVVREVHADIKEVKEQASKINVAVNNVPAGAPTLPARIASLEEHVAGLYDWTRWATMAMQIIAAHTGAELPSAPRRPGSEPAPG